MSPLKEKLINRFGEGRVKDYPRKEEDYIDLLQLDLQLNRSLTVICTNGLSDYKMPIPADKQEEFGHRLYNELFVCIPNYWELSDTDNKNMQWPLEVIQKLAKNVLEKQTWYGPGHTISNGNPTRPISDSMKQEHMILMDPILLHEYLAPIKIGDKTIRFLAIVPIYYNEFQYKNRKGHKRWARKYSLRRGDEVLDDFRQDVIKRHWKFW